jgi:hypothetical protein
MTNSVDDMPYAEFPQPVELSRRLPVAAHVFEFGVGQKQWW